MRVGTEVSSRVVGHVADVLCENALVHGHGKVRVVGRSTAGAVAVDVTDEGEVPAAVGDPFTRGPSTKNGPGVGLSMARTMASAVGGRLLLADRQPTRFTLFLPLPRTPENGTEPA